MTMMKFFYDSMGRPDEEALWAYEGVVLPGGQMMVGRWWSPEDDALTSKNVSVPSTVHRREPSI